MRDPFAQPRWAPHAVATDIGWVDPRTNELLMFIKGLPNAVRYERSGRVAEVITQSTQSEPPKRKGGWPKGKPRKKIISE